MEYLPSFIDDLHVDIKPSFIAHSFRDEHDAKMMYGLPKVKKFPMPDAKHVRSAIRFFNYAKPSQEQELANAILARMNDYGIDPDDINVGDDNRFKKYLQHSYLAHHGIKGMHWGVRRYENYDGTLTAAGKKRYEGLDRKSQKAKKKYLKMMNKDMENHFYNQLSPNARKVSAIGRNGREILGQAWGEAYRKGYVTDKDHAQIKKAAKETRSYMSKKYGDSAMNAFTRSGVLFRKIDDFDTL